MELSLFLAQLLGITTVLVGIAGLVRPQLLSAAIRDFDHESFSTLSTGVILAVAGLAIVLSHNIWVTDWRVVVTILGWIILIKGFAYLVAPKSLIDIGKAMLKDKSWLRGFLVAYLILGVYLAFKGFGY